MRVEGSGEKFKIVEIIAIIAIIAIIGKKRLKIVVTFVNSCTQGGQGPLGTSGRRKIAVTMPGGAFKKCPVGTPGLQAT